MSGHTLLLEDLRRHIAEGQVVVVVGSGVSVGASGAPVASWRGLVLDGVARCEAVVSGLPARWADRVREEIDSGDLDDLLSAAEKVSSKLKPSGGEYSRWLRETVGALRVSEPAVIRGLQALRSPILTTNYDGLLEEVTGYPAATWRESANVERIVRGDEPGVVHLHGYWREPTSVVLGIRSYEQLLGDVHTQAMLRALRSTRTLLFVGYGAGISNPNFRAFLRWSREIFAGSEFRHFRLALERDLNRFQLEHPPEERIFVLPYGETHAGLADFLRTLAPDTQDFERASESEIATEVSWPTQRPLRVFFSCAPEDEIFRTELEACATNSFPEGKVEILREPVKTDGKRDFLSSDHLEAADIVVLLVSAGFLAADDLRGGVMRRVLARHRDGRCAVVPVLVRACDWRDAPFSGIEVLPRDSRPINSHTGRSEVYKEVVAELRELIEQLLRARAAVIE